MVVSLLCLELALKEIDVKVKCHQNLHLGIVTIHSGWISSLEIFEKSIDVRQEDSSLLQKV